MRPKSLVQRVVMRMISRTVRVMKSCALRPRAHRQCAFASTLAVVLLALLASSCSREPETLHGIIRDEPLNVGSISLPDVTGESASSSRFGMRAAPGELLFVYFGYTACPDLCPTTLATWKSAIRQTSDAAALVDTVFVTVDPSRDTPQILNDYVGSFVDRFHVLRTTNPADMQSALDAFLAAATIETTAEGKTEVSHTTVAYLVDERGEVVVEWPFGTSADAMASDLKILLGTTRQQSQKEEQ